MKLLTIVFALILSLQAVVPCSIIVDVEVRGNNYKAAMKLLPVYGWTKLNKLFSQYAFSKTFHFFQKNTNHYKELRKKLSTVGLELPELSELDLSAFTDGDFKLIKVLTKDTTFKQALSLEYVSSLLNEICVDRNLFELLQGRLEKVGFKYDKETFDLNRAIQVGLDTFEPMVLNYIPTGINIAVFG